MLVTVYTELLDGMPSLSILYFWCVFSALNDTTLPSYTPNPRIILYTYLTDLATVLHKTFFLSYKRFNNYKSILRERVRESGGSVELLEVPYSV